MNRLITLNQDGTYRVGNRGGYRIAGKLTKGVHAFLKIDLGMKKKDMYKSGKSKLHKKLTKVGRIEASNKEKGRRIHRYLFHEFVCTFRCTCFCKSRCGQQTIRMPSKQSTDQTYIEAAKLFVKKYNLCPLEGELIIACNDYPLATQVDSIMKSTFTNGLYLISWKTGLCPPRTSPQFKLNMMQLSIEWAMLERYYNIKVHYAVIVYLVCITDRRTGYNCPSYSHVRLDRKEAIGIWDHVIEKLKSKKKK